MEIFYVFTALTLKQISEKGKPFSKTWSTATGVLKPQQVEKTSRMGSNKSNCHKERRSANNHSIFFFFKLGFSLRTSYKELI